MISIRSKFLMKIIITMSFSVILLFFSHHLVLISSWFLYPCLKVQNVINYHLKHFLTGRQKNKLLRQYLKDLQEQNEKLHAKNIELIACEHYYQQIHELVTFKQKYLTTSAFLSQIILKQFTEHEHSFLIDRGSCHGIEIDMVAVYKNNLVGRVTEVYPYYSKIILITDSSCKVAAYCKSSKARGIHEGLNKEITSLRFVSHLHPLIEHDILISSGEGLIFPQGFAIGTIEDFKPNGLYYDVDIKPFLNLKDLEYCYIIKK